MNEPASVEWLRSQLPHGWLIVSPEVVSAMRRLLRWRTGNEVYGPMPEGQWHLDVSVVESALKGASE